MKRNLLIGTSLAVASFATPEARYVATTDAAFKESTSRADAYAIAVKAFESETTEGKVALKAGETPTTLLNRALSEEAGRQALADILKAENDVESLRAALNDSSSKKAALAAFARALSTNAELRKFVEEFRQAVVAQGSGAKKKGDTGSDVQGPVQPVKPDIGKNVPVIVEQPNYVTLSKDVLSAEQALVQAMRDEYSARTAAAEAAEAVKRAQAAKESASSSLQTATKVAEDARTKATEAKTALTAAEEALNALNTKNKELDESVKAAEIKAAGKADGSEEVLAFNKLNAEIKVLDADIAIKTAAVTAARAKDAEAETASKEAADKAAAAKTAYDLAAEAFTAAEKASKEASDKDAAAKTAQAEANTKLAAAIKAALEAATKEAEKASKEAVAKKAAADAAEIKKTELQTAAQTAKDRVIELGKRQTGLHSELTAARAVDTANSTAETQAVVKAKEAAVIDIATELVKAEINAKHAEQAADDAVKAAAKTAHDAENAAEAKEAADSNLSAATEKAKNNTVIEAVKEEIVKQEESRLAAEKQAEAEKVSKDAAEKAAAEKAAAEKAAEIADAVTKALAKAKETADAERKAALAEARKAAEADKAAAVAAAKAQAEVDKAAAAEKAAADAAAAAQQARQDAVDARAKSQNDLTNAALKDAADAAEQRAKDAEAAKLTADNAAAAAKQAVAAAEAEKLEAEKAATAAKQAAAKQTAAAADAEQRAAAAEADKQAADANAAAAEQRAADAADAAHKARQEAADAKQAAEQEVARSAKSVQDLQIQLSSAQGEIDRQVKAKDKADKKILELESQLNALTDEAKVYNPDKAFAELISTYKADLMAAETAKAAADDTIKALRSDFKVDNMPYVDESLPLTEVRATAVLYRQAELVKAIDAYTESSLVIDTTNRVLDSANKLQVLSEVEGVEGKPSDAVARIINRHIARKKSEALDRLLHSGEPSIVVIPEVAEGFEEFKEIVDIYNSVKDLIDADVSGTENDETSLNGGNVSGTEAEVEAEAEAVRETEPAEELYVVHAKSERDGLIGQLRTIVKGFDVDTKTLNDAALTLVSATIDRFNGMLDSVRDPYNPSVLFQSLYDLQKGLNAPISKREGRYESVYKLLGAISAMDKNIQAWKKANDEIKNTKKTDDVLAPLSAGDIYAYKLNMHRLESNKNALERQLQTIIDPYADEYEEEEAHASSIQNLTADTLGALKSALAQYNDYLNSVISSTDKDMLLRSDRDTCERIMAAYDLTLSNIDEDAKKVFDSRNKHLASMVEKQEMLKSINDNINVLRDVPAISTALTVLDPAKTSQYNDQERVEANKTAERYLLLVKDKKELESQIDAYGELLERIRADYNWLIDAYHDVKEQRRKMLLGGKEFVAAITTAITTILSPVPAAAEREYDTRFAPPMRSTESGDDAVDGSGDDTDDRGALVTGQTEETSSDSAQRTGQTIDGAFASTVQGYGQTSESAVGFGPSAADTTQTPPPPPPAAVVNSGSSTPPAAQSGDGASVVNSGNSTPDNQPAAVGQDPAAVDQPAAPARSQSGDGASAVNSGNSTPDNQPAAVGQDNQDLTPEDRQILKERDEMAAL